MFTMIIIAEVIIIKKETNADVSLMFSINDTMLWLLEKLSSEGQVKVKSRKKSRRKREDLTSQTVLSLLHTTHPPYTFQTLLEVLEDFAIHS